MMDPVCFGVKKNREESKVTSEQEWNKTEFFSLKKKKKESDDNEKKIKRPQKLRMFFCAPK